MPDAARTFKKLHLRDEIPSDSSFDLHFYFGRHLVPEDLPLGLPATLKDSDIFIMELPGWDESVLGQYQAIANGNSNVLSQRLLALRQAKARNPHPELVFDDYVTELTEQLFDTGVQVVSTDVAQGKKFREYVDATDNYGSGEIVIKTAPNFEVAINRFGTLLKDWIKMIHKRDEVNLRGIEKILASTKNGERITALFGSAHTPLFTVLNDVMKENQNVSCTLVQSLLSFEHMFLMYHGYLKGAKITQGDIARHYLSERTPHVFKDVQELLSMTDVDAIAAMKSVTGKI